MRILLLATALAGLGDTIMSWLEASDGLAGYGILLVAFLIGSVGAPLPEEAVLAMGGYLAATGQLSLVGVYFFGYTVVLLIDCFLYHVGRKAGPALERSRIGKRITPAKMASARRFFDRYGTFAIVGARFVMGTRIPVFVLSGALGVPPKRYYAAVALSGLVSNAIPVLLGYYLADQITDVLSAIDQAHGWFFVGTIIALVLVIALVYVFRRRRARAGAPEPKESSEGDETV